MKPRYIEGLVKHLLAAYAAGDQDGIVDRARIKEVLTFEEAGYTTKPCGVRIECEDGSAVFVQFVGTAPPGGGYPQEPHYYMSPEKVGAERYGD